MLSPSRQFGSHQETHDLEGAKTTHDERWGSGDAEVMNSVFNEMVELKSSFRAVKKSVLVLFGLVIVLLVVTIGASFASLVDSKRCRSTSIPTA
jgi:hypothetical protein